MSEKKEPEQLRKLFIGGLNDKSTEESLKSHFKQWGEIVGCVVVRDHHRRKFRRFGFITYKHAHMVDAAQAARPHKIDGKEVETKRAVPRDESGKPEPHVTVNKLYVRGIADDLEEKDLRDYFGPYGNIVGVNVVTDKNTGKKKGFAFVEFDDYDPVDKIVLQRHNYKGRELVVQKPLSRGIKMKKKMGGFREGRADSSGGIGERSTDDSSGGIGERSTDDESDRGGYVGGYGVDYANSYDVDYANSYGVGYANSYGVGYASSYGVDYANSYSVDYASSYGGGYAGIYGGGYASIYGGGYANSYGGGYANSYGGGYANSYGGGYGNEGSGGWSEATVTSTAPEGVVAREAASVPTMAVDTFEAILAIPSETKSRTVVDAGQVAMVDDNHTLIIN